VPYIASCPPPQPPLSAIAVGLFATGVFHDKQRADSLTLHVSPSAARTRNTRAFTTSTYAKRLLLHRAQGRGVGGADAMVGPQAASLNRYLIRNDNRIA